MCAAFRLPHRDSSRCLAFRSPAQPKSVETSLDAGRGRDSDCPLPPAQTRARAPNAHGSHLGDKHAQAIDLHALPRHCSAPVFSGAVSSIGPCLGISLADRLPSTCSAGSPLPLFADFVGTMRSLDSPRPCMEDLWLIAFSSPPAHYL